MIGRITILEADKNKIDEGISFVRNQVQPLVDSLPGSHGLGMWVNRETGDVVVNTVWQDRPSLEASESQVSSVRAEAARVVGAKTVRVEVVEPTVVWQAAADQPGYWSRAVEMDVPAGRIEEAITLFRDEMLAKIKGITGVNTVIYSADRNTGHTMLNVTYRSKAELDAGREAGNTMRAGVVARLGAGQPTIREMETAIVGIRGPATIDVTGSQAHSTV